MAPGLQNTFQNLTATANGAVGKIDTPLAVPYLVQSTQSARIRKEQIEKISKLHDLVEYYLFSQQTAIAGRDAGSRMFAPKYGINEEAATGMAAGPLACFLHNRLGISKRTFLIEQGRLMPEPSPGIIHVRLKIDQNVISGLLAGGNPAVREVRSIEI
jgi:PhzF family phenazine biosynthesis protein